MILCSSFSFFLILSTLAYQAQTVEFDLPIARIYKVEGTRLRPWNRVDSNSETTVEGIEILRLECMASYPVQWIYTGNGIPAYSSSNKYSRTNNHGETVSQYSATVILDPLKEHHTGKYQCSPAQYIDLRTFFYIYVPGQNLFTTMNGHNIMLPKNDTSITIPCTVSNPNAAVTLERSEGSVIRGVKVRSSDAVTYDPKLGFRVKTDKVDNPEGTYVCTAKYGSMSRSVEYTVRGANAQYQSDQPQTLSKCKKRCGENAYCDIVNGQESCQCMPEFRGDPNLKCVIKCNAHTDCPDTMSCFVDKQCRDPCVHSAVGCGVNAKCKVEKHRPVCYCPPDWVGDETIQCFNTLQGSQSQSGGSVNRPSSSPGKPQAPNPSAPKLPPTSSGTKCGSNTDCPNSLTCIRINPGATQKECVDPCTTRRCGRNADCIVEDHRSSCECKKGFTGDARIECSPTKLEREPAEFEPLIQGDEEFRPFEEFPIVPKKRCGRPDQCGLNADCSLDKKGNPQCKCLEGYMGQPPKCRPECRQNSDCPDAHVCVRDTRVGYPTCAKSCGSRVCGAHSDCVEITEGNLECYCPPGTYGDPMVKCETPELVVGKDCSTDYDCGVKLKCEIGPDERKCVNPCDKKSCKGDLICDVRDHKAVCKCPPFTTGNEYVGCIKDSDSQQAILCANITCGPNSECRVFENQPKCFCQSGFIGKPPVCIAECFSNTDCPQDLTCVQKRCRHRCDGCGLNTKCRVAPNMARDSVCSCLDGFVGNPYKECKPVT